jgi:hypothetical protein
VCLVRAARLPTEPRSADEPTAERDSLERRARQIIVQMARIEQSARRDQDTDWLGDNAATYRRLMCEWWALPPLRIDVYRAARRALTRHALPNILDRSLTSKAPQPSESPGFRPTRNERKTINMIMRLHGVDSPDAP